MEEAGGTAAGTAAGKAAGTSIESFEEPVRNIIEPHIIGYGREGIVWKRDDSAAKLPAELLRVLMPASAELRRLSEENERLKRDLQQANSQKEESVNNLQRCRENIKKMSVAVGHGVTSLLIAEGIAPEGLQMLSSSEVKDLAMTQDKDMKDGEWKNISQTQHQLAAKERELAAQKRELAAKEKEPAQNEKTKRSDEFDSWKAHFDKFIMRDCSDVLNQHSIYSLLDMEPESSDVNKQCKRLLRIFHSDKTEHCPGIDLITRILTRVKGIVDNDSKKKAYDNFLGRGFWMDGDLKGTLQAMTAVEDLEEEIAKQNTINEEREVRERTKRTEKEHKEGAPDNKAADSGEIVCVSEEEEGAAGGERAQSSRNVFDGPPPRLNREGTGRGKRDGATKRSSTTNSSRKRHCAGSKIDPFFFDPWSETSVDGLKKCMLPYIRALTECSMFPRYKLQWAQQNSRKSVPHDHWVDISTWNKVNNKMEVSGESTIMQALLEWMNAGRVPLPDCDGFQRSSDKRAYAIGCFEVYVQIVEVEKVTSFPVNCPMHLQIDHSFWEQLKINDLGMQGWDLMFGWNPKTWKTLLGGKSQEGWATSTD